MSERYGYEALKAMAKRLGRSASSLYALASSNDPFYAGSPAGRAQAEWFAEQWERFGRKGAHARHIHYRMISQPEPIRMLDGRPYENEPECWKALVQASKVARYLDLVPLEDFADNRTPPPTILLEPDTTSAGAGVASAMLFDLDLPEGLPDLPELRLRPPSPEQRYHVEIWAEKSGADDVLIPLGRDYRANVVTGKGELSLTACHRLIERATTIGRPVRILYVSDFDPAGLSMPVAVARKMEFLAQRAGLELDIQVRPIVLTHEQCVAYRLPRIPIKKKERRAGRFEARFGTGATELDALEALHPGELRRILEAELDRYFDHGLSRRIAKRANAIRQELDASTASVHERHAASIDALRAEYAEIYERATAWRERADAVWQAITSDLEAEAPTCDDEWPEADAGTEDADPLFDSTRDYLTQMTRYKRHQGKPDGEAPDDDDAEAA